MFDHSRLRVFPLAERKSLTRIEDILIDPDSPAPVLSEAVAAQVARAAADIRAARTRGAAVMLIYGAHLLRNGTSLILDRMMEKGWLSHLATNGAGTIHDWEYAWLGRSTESVKDNVAAGTFGAWDETGRALMLALLAAGVDGLGYGAAIGRLVCEDGVSLPSAESLEASLREAPGDPRAPARAELLATMRAQGVTPGWHSYVCRWKQASLLASAWRLGVPATAHPGVGYDIVSCHPLFSGAAVGRAAERDFALFGGSVDRLDGGVVLSVGSAIMGPQVFEKSLSCVHNLRFAQGRPPVRDHAFFVVDLQPGGGWDWSVGEPPKTNPAYYLRFCKSFSRMGGAMRYLECDNALFVRHLARGLE